MKMDLEENFYSEQVPALMEQLRRIADALERNVELLEKRQAAVDSRMTTEKATQSVQREEQRKKLETQLQKLAELDRMARELRSKLEQKRAAEATAAFAQVGRAGEVETADGGEETDQSSGDTAEGQSVKPGDEDG